MAKYLIWRDITLPKVNKQRDEVEQTLSNTKMCLFLPSFWPAIANDPSDYQ